MGPAARKERHSMKRLAIRILSLALAVCLLTGMYLPAEASELKTAIGTVTASSLRLRAEPNTNCQILANAYRGDKVVVIRQTGDWYEVIFNLKHGYMHGDYLTLSQVETVKIGYARFDYVTNVRQGPGTDTSIVARAPKNETCFIVGFNNGWYKVSYNGRPGYVRSDLVTMLEIPYGNYGSPGNTYHEGSDNGGSGSSSGSGSGSSPQLGAYGMSRAAKLQLVFGTSNVSEPRTYYSSYASAYANMTSITIKTWDINSNGAKYTRTWNLVVHKNIAPTVQAIFDEIYALPEQVPIHSVGGFRWCGKSEHSVGLAIDINPNENYYCDPSGHALTGSYFRPGTDPYSIPLYGSVDQIFAKYGFSRGINWRSGYRDYMHYSFFGT